MLAWFARSSSYAGGASLPGYLSAMRARFVAELPKGPSGKVQRLKLLEP